MRIYKTIGFGAMPRTHPLHFRYLWELQTCPISVKLLEQFHLLDLRANRGSRFVFILCSANWTLQHLLKPY